uniref:Putative control protein n=1 Tax=Thermus filiformis TaxID=276 RepID=Q9F8S2_THEFI|nr:putative control protein [Thermus filiformis]
MSEETQDELKSLRKPHTFRVNERLIRVLKALASIEGKSLSEMVEEAILQYLRKEYKDFMRNIPELEPDRNSFEEER